MKNLEEDVSGRLARGSKGWSIVFYDIRINEPVVISLDIFDKPKAVEIFVWWATDQNQRICMSAPRPVMGMSVARAISDYLMGPDIIRHPGQIKWFGLSRAIAAFFGQMAVQEITADYCRSYAELRRKILTENDKSEVEMRSALRQIRKELIFLRNIVDYAKRWQRIIDREKPTIYLNVIPNRLTHEELLGPIQLEQVEKVTKIGGYASVSDVMNRRWIRNYKTPSER